jgi:hypothetical protein
MSYGDSGHSRLARHALAEHPGSGWGLARLEQGAVGAGQASQGAINRDLERSWALADTALRAVH